VVEGRRGGKVGMKLNDRKLLIINLPPKKKKKKKKEK